MADISTAVSMARVPILGENGRISDDYIPAAIGENVTKAESAATRAESAATAAEGSASAASQSATQASGSASAASASASQAQQSATTAGGAATSAQSAQTAAEAAKAAAEAAQSAAAGSAQDAQQSATAAASSAASVADKFIASAQATTLEPGSQATASVENQVLTIGVPKGEKGDKGDQGEKGDPGTGVPDGGAPGQLLSKTDSGTAWVDPPSTGNVLVGTSTGYIAHAEDAYAAKPREVRIEGRTVKNLWPAINDSIKGVTVSTDETGLITVNGTAEGNANVAAGIFEVKPNSNFSVVATLPAASVTKSTFWLIVADGESHATVKSMDADDNAGVTFNFGNRTKMLVSVFVNAGVTVNASFRVMLVEGDTVPDCFVPTGLHSVGQLREDEKNLWVNPTDRTTSGVTLTNNDDGSITVSGTNTAGGTIYMGATGPFALKAGKTYTMSIDGDPDFSAYVNFRDSENSLLGSESVGASNGQSSTTFSSPSSTSVFQLGISVQAGATVSGTYHVMLNEGSTAQPWVAPGTEGKIRVVTAGKNLLDEDAPTVDGVVGPQLPPGDYVLSGMLPSGASMRLLNGGADGETITDTSSLPYAFSSGYPFTPYYAGVGGYATGLMLELGSTATAYEPLNITTTPLPGVELRSLPDGTCDELVIAQDGTATVERRTQLVDGEVVALDEPTTEPQSPVTLPVLPAPTFNVYHVSDVPSNTTVTYERDINIAFDKLQAQVSALNIMEATNG